MCVIVPILGLIARRTVALPRCLAKVVVEVEGGIPLVLSLANHFALLWRESSLTFLLSVIKKKKKNFYALILIAVAVVNIPNDIHK